MSMKFTAYLRLFLLASAAIQSDANSNHIVLLEPSSTSVTVHFFPAQDVQAYNCSVNLEEESLEKNEWRVVHQDEMGGRFHNQITFDSLLPNKLYIFLVSFDGSVANRYTFFTANQQGKTEKNNLYATEKPKQSVGTPPVQKRDYKKTFEEMIRELELLQLVQES